MDEHWTIEDNFLIVNDKAVDSRIKEVRNSLQLGKIEVVVENGKEYHVSLSRFMCNNKEGFTETCKRSRTEFLNWLASQKKKVNGLLDEPSYVIITNKRKSTDLENSRGKMSLEEEHISETDFTLMKTDQETLNSCLIGKNVTVHQENLIEPLDSKKVRDLDDIHVKKLEERIEKSGKVFTVLLGIIEKKDINLEELKLPCIHKVQVIGGNHTRQALQNTGCDNSVTMDIYFGLNDMQALKLGMSHNEIHQTSRNTSFEDKVKLFRKLHHVVKEEYPSKSLKFVTMEWRSRIGDIMSLETRKVKNHFQTHLHCASLPQTAWDGLLMLFVSWRCGKVKNCPKTEMKQTHMCNLFRIHDIEKKATLLRDLATGKISFPEFKICCKRPEAETKYKTTTEKRALDDVASTVSNNSRRSEVDENIHLREELHQEKMKSERLEALVTSLKEKCNNLTAETRQKEKTFSDWKENLLKETDRKIKEMKERLEIRTCEIEAVRLQLVTAEDVANRARIQMKELKRRQEEHVSEKSKEKEPLAKKQKISLREETDEQELQVQVSSNESVKIGVVEYNNNNVYFGTINEGKFTFAKSTIGKLEVDIDLSKVKKTALTIKPNDIMDYDSAFLICSFDGCIKNNTIILSEKQIDHIKINIQDYISKRMQN